MRSEIVKWAPVTSPLQWWIWDRCEARAGGKVGKNSAWQAKMTAVSYVEWIGNLIHSVICLQLKKKKWNFSVTATNRLGVRRLSCLPLTGYMAQNNLLIFQYLFVERGSGSRKIWIESWHFYLLAVALRKLITLLILISIFVNRSIMTSCFLKE